MASISSPITNNTNPVTIPSPTGSTATSSSASGSSAAGAAGMANEQTFLQLLVAQLQNQDPLNPTDSMQFVSQLAQFSELEQMIGVHADLDTIVKAASSATPATQTGTTPPATQTGATPPSTNP